MRQSIGFTGYLSDEEAGTSYAKAREYLPQIGRFAAEDVYGGSIAVPYSQNRYSYCYNNPLVLVDGDGRKPTWKKLKKKVGETWEEFTKWLKTDDGKIIFTTVTIGTVGIGTTLFGHPEGLGVAIGSEVGAISNGISNKMVGGSFANGYVGGAVNGAITTFGYMQGGGIASSFFGGTIGTMVTKLLEAKDKGEQVDYSKIFLESAGVGLFQLSLAQMFLNPLDKSSAGLNGYIRGIGSFFKEDLSLVGGTSSGIFVDAMYEYISEIVNKKERRKE